MKISITLDGVQSPEYEIDTYIMNHYCADDTSRQAKWVADSIAPVIAFMLENGHKGEKMFDDIKSE